MSFLHRLFGVSRTTGPYRPADPALSTFFGFVPSAAGVNVDEYSALNYTAVWAATWLISRPLATVPLRLYERYQKPGAEQPGYRVIEDHPVAEMFRDGPNPETRKVDWLESSQAKTLNWGNSYGVIERDRGGHALAIWPQPPKDVRPDRDKAGRLVYQVTGIGSDVPIAADDMLHVPGPGFDGIVGYNVIRMARETIGVGMAERQFGATFFGNGCTTKGTLKIPGRPSVETRAEMRRSIEAAHQGPDRAHRVVVTWDGAEFDPKGGLIPPETAQFLESREFERGEVALWYCLPLASLGVGKSVSYNSAAQVAEDLVRYGLRPWAVRWEEHLNYKLLTPQERGRMVSRFDLDALLRGNMPERTKARVQQFTYGAINTDEWRADEFMNPLDKDEGQKHYVPTNLRPVDAPLPKSPLPGEAAVGPSKPEKQFDRAALAAAAQGVFLDAYGRLLRKELAAVRRAAKTPASFLATIEEFYAGHEQLMGEALTPAMRVAQVVQGKETHGPAEEARQLAQRETVGAKAALLELAGMATPKTLEAAVNALCDRWENERPAAYSPDQPREDDGKFGEGGGGKETDDEIKQRREEEDGRIDKAREREASQLERKHERLGEQEDAPINRAREKEDARTERRREAEESKDTPAEKEQKKKDEKEDRQIDRQREKEKDRYLDRQEKEGEDKLGPNPSKEERVKEENRQYHEYKEWLTEKEKGWNKEDADREKQRDERDRPRHEEEKRQHKERWEQEDRETKKRRDAEDDERYQGEADREKEDERLMHQKWDREDAETKRRRDEEDSKGKK